MAPPDRQPTSSQPAAYPWRDRDTELGDRYAIRQRYEPTDQQLASARLQPDSTLREAIAAYGLLVATAGPRLLLGPVTGAERDVLMFGHAARAVYRERDEEVARQWPDEYEDPADAWYDRMYEAHLFAQALAVTLPSVLPPTVADLETARSLDRADLDERINIGASLLTGDVPQAAIFNEGETTDVPRLLAEASAAVTVLEERHPEERARWDGHPELAELIVDTREYAAFDAGVIQSALRGVVPSDEWECLMGDLTERYRNGEPIDLHTTLLRHIRDTNTWVIQDTADRAILAWAATDWTPPTWCLPDDAPPDADPSEVGHLPSFQEAILGPDRRRALLTAVEQHLDQLRPDWRELGIVLPTQEVVHLAVQDKLPPKQIADVLSLDRYEQLQVLLAAAKQDRSSAADRLEVIDSTLEEFNWWERNISRRGEVAELTTKRNDCLQALRQAEPLVQQYGQQLASFAYEPLTATEQQPDWTPADEGELRQLLTDLLGPPGPRPPDPTDHTLDHGLEQEQ